MLAAGTVRVVLLIVAALVIAKLTSSSDPAASGAKALDPAVATKADDDPRRDLRHGRGRLSGHRSEEDRR